MHGSREAVAKAGKNKGEAKRNDTSARRAVNQWSSEAIGRRPADPEIPCLILNTFIIFLKKNLERHLSLQVSKKCVPMHTIDRMHCTVQNLLWCWSVLLLFRRGSGDASGRGSLLKASELHWIRLIRRRWQVDRSASSAFLFFFFHSCSPVLATVLCWQHLDLQLR